jgi:uncharacterized protein GlcG (DUF336 family)
MRPATFERAKAMSVQSIRIVAGTVALVMSTAGAFAQLPNPYGMSINGENAKKAAGAALGEARRNNWTMAAAVVDTAGDLVYFEKLDGTQAASVDIAVDKARSAARFKRPTKALQDVLAAGGEGLRMLRLQGAVPVEGGVPLVMDGKIVGAIGLSGGTSAQDGQCAKAGAETVK